MKHKAIAFMITVIAMAIVIMNTTLNDTGR
jgi:hypothetical protein